MPEDDVFDDLMTVSGYLGDAISACQGSLRSVQGAQALEEELMSDVEKAAEAARKLAEVLGRIRTTSADYHNRFTSVQGQSEDLLEAAGRADDACQQAMMRAAGIREITGMVGGELADKVIERESRLAEVAVKVNAGFTQAMNASRHVQECEQRAAENTGDQRLDSSVKAVLSGTADALTQVLDRLRQNLAEALDDQLSSVNQTLTDAKEEVFRLRTS